MADPKTNPIAYAIGDLHLDRLIWKRHRDVTGDSVLGFTQVCDLAYRDLMPLLILGDLFDTTEPDPDLVRLVREQFRRLAQAGVRVMAIQGNHDRQDVPWYLACSGDVQHVGDGVPFEIGGIRFVGLDFATKDVIQERLAQLAGRTASGEIKADVLLLHQAVRQYLSIEGKWNCDLEWVPREITKVLMGDIHEPIDVPYPGGRAHYSGSTHPRSITEFGPKSIMALHRDLSVTRLPLVGRQCRKFVLTPMSNPDEVVAELDQLLSLERHLPPLAWVRHDDRSLELVERLRAHVSGTPLIFLTEPIVGRVELEESNEVEAAEVPTPVQALSQLVDRAIEPDVFQLGVDLLAARSPKDVTDRIQSARDRFFAANNVTA